LNAQSAAMEKPCGLSSRQEAATSLLPDFLDAQSAAIHGENTNKTLKKFYCTGGLKFSFVPVLQEAKGLAENTAYR